MFTSSFNSRYFLLGIIYVFDYICDTFSAEFINYVPADFKNTELENLTIKISKIARLITKVKYCYNLIIVGRNTNKILHET